MTTRSDTVRGDIEPATRDGFVALLKKANEFLEKEENADYRMLTVVRLEKAIAAIYVRVASKKAITQFWEEDDVEV
jgi:hypothetical protein